MSLEYVSQIGIGAINTVAQRIGSDMRATFRWSALWILLCSCAPPAVPASAVTTTPMPEPTLTATPKFNLGDGWSVHSLTTGNQTTCTAEISQANPPVTLNVYYLGDTGKPDPVLQLIIRTPSTLTGPVTYPNLFVVHIDGKLAAAVDPDASTVQQGMAFLSTATEMGQNLANEFAHARTVEVLRTNQTVTSFQPIVTAVVPHPGALLRSLIACEQSGVSEAATRAAYRGR